jgi:hypothetical protein
MAHSWRSRLLGVAMLATLCACATAPPQATVQTFTPAPQLPAGSTYRHERLPSQAGRPDLAFLESVADSLLARAGLSRSDANAGLALQLTVSQDAVAYGPAWGPSWMSVGIGGGSWSGGGVGVGLNFPVGGSAAAYPVQRVDVLLRDLAGGQVVFQSQASGVGMNPAMLLEAALRDFPNGPPGIRVLPLPPPPAR